MVPQLVCLSILLLLFCNNLILQHDNNFITDCSSQSGKVHVHFQRAKKVVSDSPGLVDFATVLVIFVLNLPDGQVLFFGGNANYRRIVINPANQKGFRGS